MNLELILLVTALAAITVALGWHAIWEAPRKERKQTSDLLRAFARAVELRFPANSGLTEKTLEYALRLGTRSHLKSGQMGDLEQSVFLRDIGLCAIPYSLLNQTPVVAWQDEDRLLYGRHPQIGAEIIERIPSIEHLRAIIRCHHMPFSTGNQPITARILKIAGDFAAIERSQGRLLATQHLRDGQGTEYDPALVDLFLGSASQSHERQPETVTA